MTTNLRVNDSVHEALDICRDKRRVVTAKFKIREFSWRLLVVIICRVDFGRRPVSDRL